MTKRNAHQDIDKVMVEVELFRLYVTDLTPNQLLSFGAGSYIFPPNTLFEKADAHCKLNGGLIEYLKRNPLYKPQFVPNMSEAEWHEFLGSEFNGRSVEIYQGETKNFLYTVAIVVARKPTRLLLILVDKLVDDESGFLSAFIRQYGIRMGPGFCAYIKYNADFANEEECPPYMLSWHWRIIQQEGWKVEEEVFAETTTGKFSLDFHGAIKGHFSSMPSFEHDSPVNHGPYLGISLGTAYCCASVIMDGVPAIISTPEGDFVSPSIVGFSRSQQILVGSAARRQLVTSRERMFCSIVRFLGRSVDSLTEEELELIRPNGIRSDADNKLLFVVEEHGYPTSELVSRLISYLHSNVVDFVGKSINHVVLVVPDFYDDVQCASARNAAVLSGLEVVKIIKRSTAILKALESHHLFDGKTVLFDLQEDCLSVSIVNVTNGACQLLKTRMSCKLGGEAISRILCMWIVEHASVKFGIRLEKDRMASQRIQEAAHRVLDEISITYVGTFPNSVAQRAAMAPDSVTISLPFISATEAGPLHLETEITRSNLENLFDSYVGAFINCGIDLLEESGLGVKDIDKVILTGDRTRLPIIREKVRTIFGNQVIEEPFDDYLASSGGAVEAAQVEAGSSDEGPTDVRQFESLVSELIEIGRTIKVPPGYADSGFFRVADTIEGRWDPRTRQIGELLLKMGNGNIKLMKNARHLVQQAIGSSAAHDLSAVWHKIGLGNREISDMLTGKVENTIGIDCWIH